MCIINMPFLKTHLRRNSSERSRFAGLATGLKHRKSESSSSRTASVPDTKQDHIDFEVENLFQQATDTTRDHASSRHRDSKTDSSLFHKLMKRKDSHSKSTSLKEGIRRSFSQRVRPKSLIELKPNNDAVRRGSSPDFASETGYDSDAAFIASPRFSEQSWDSIRPSSPVAIDRTITSLNQVLAEDTQSRPNSNDDTNAAVLLPTRPQPNSLSVSKRRTKVEHPVDKNGRSYSRWVPSINLSNEGERTKRTPLVTKNVPRKSRFSELFDHPGLHDEASTQQPRKVSVGWMSEGKRCGYGYSFVDEDEATDTPCTTDGPADNSYETEEKESVADEDEATITEALADDSSETEETGSSTDATLVDDGQNADQFSQSNAETSSEPEDRESIFIPEKDVTLVNDSQNAKGLGQSLVKTPSEPELTLSSYQRYRWTLFPTFTRVERNQSTNLDDTVIVRDFCPKASPDRSQQEENGEERKHHLIANAIRQGVHDTFLWVIGLGKREIARYHAGLQVQAARSHENIDLTFEMTVPFWDHVPKEEVGDYHIEAWRAAKRRPKKRSGNLEKWKVSVAHAVNAAARKARTKSTSSFSSSSLSSSSSTKLSRERFPYDVDNGRRYVSRRHSAKF